MLQKLGLVDLIAAIQTRIEQGTGVRCYDNVPLNAPSPFYFAEVAGKRPEDTKTMYCEVITVMVHAISTPDGGNVAIYDLIERLEESMTEDIILPEPFQLLLQSNVGVQAIKTDETNERHAILRYDFKVNYGFKTK